MLAEAVRHFLQREPHVFEADLLADNVEGHVRKALMHCLHHSRQDGAVAHAGIEHAHRRRTRVNAGELERHAIGDHPFLAASVDEQQVFLTVVEKAKIALRVGGERRRRDRRGGPGRRPLDHARPFERGRIAMRRNEAADAIDRVGGDAAAVAQAAVSLPSLTARRPNVDSATPAARQ